MRVLLIILLAVPALAFSQPYGNEWINFNQDYYKIMVPDNGLYRVSYDDLNNAGFPVDSVDPRLLQMFRRGQQTAIHVSGEEDGRFDSSDYIEFYGQRNDGKLDEQLYVAPEAQQHQYLSLYADSSAYFLTVHPLISGDRIATNPSFTGLPADNWADREEITVLYDNYERGLALFSGNQDYPTQLTQFDFGEGFTGSSAIEVARPSEQIQISGIVLRNETAPDPILELIVLGRNNLAHSYEVLVGPSTSDLTSIGTYSFNGYTHQKVETSIDWNRISSSGDLWVQITVIDNGGSRSFLSISAAKLKYARLTDVAGASHLEFLPETKASGGSVLNITNVPIGGIAYDITNPEDVKFFTDNDPDVNTINLGISDASTSKRIAVSSPSTSFSVNKASLRFITPSNHNYLIVSHPRIMNKPDTTAVQDYAAYRASAQGGSFDTLVVDVNMLYNQFSYGQPSPLAIYRFMEYMSDSGDPEHLFLIGKSLDIRYRYYKRDSSTLIYQDLVPTAGSPGSDLAYTMGLGTDPNKPEIPVGRLSVMWPTEVANYLEKVKEIESTPHNELWRKDLLHLSGGNSLYQLELFKDYVDGFAEVANGHYLGGEVTTISKQTTAPVEKINVADEVNAGVNLITFFGHSTPNITDIDIGFVSDPENMYANQGKYPLILMNGCNIGNIYDYQYIFGEDWIATAEKGATGVIAHSSYGYPSKLRRWTQTFYSLAYADSTLIKKSIGQIMEATNESFLSFAGPNPNYIDRTQVQQMGLQGDPAVKLFGTYIPDYETNDNTLEFLSIEGTEVTAELDSFLVKLVVRNFGAYIDDSLEVAINRTLPNDSIIYYDTLRFAPARYLDTLTIVLDNFNIDAAGNNFFEVWLDPGNKIYELDELNNDARYTLTINTSGTYNVAPYNYSLQSEKTVDLKFHPGNLLMEARPYEVEMDTSYRFDSPYIQNPPASGEGLISVEGIDLIDNDTTVYYWQTRYEQPNSNESADWAKSSFVVIDGASPGWAQLEYGQIRENSFEGLDDNESSRSFDFKKSTVDIEIIAHGTNSLDYTFVDTKVRIDGTSYNYYVEPNQWFTYCADNRLNLVAFSKDNAVPYAPIYGIQTDRWTRGRSPQIINSFPEGKTVDEMIDAIGYNDRVVLFTTGSFDFNTLSPETLSRLEDLGADLSVLSAKPITDPYILVGFKGAGAGNSIAEIIADPADTIPDDQQTISFTGNIEGNYTKGKIATGKIGPANNWQSLQLNIKTPDPSDQFSFDLIGYGLDGEPTILDEDLSDQVTDLTSLDAAIYPYLQLDLEIEDTVTLTAPQLDYWIINYTPTVEGYLEFDSLNEITEQNIVLEEGEELWVKLSFTNISDQSYKADSLLVSYSNFNQTTRTPPEELDIIIRAPLPGETVPVRLYIDTKGKVGENDLTVFVNPMVEPEQEFANNRINLRNYLSVVKDDTNPVLDVSIDGEYIFDGDIVSPNPNITIQIRDENPFLSKIDTTGVDIFFKRPGENTTSERVSLASSDVMWTAENDKDPFTIEFTPKELENGIYELQVQVEDASGNASGTVPYKISFEVINESTVTNFYPYPNPFSTSVKFIFTLTGNEVPDEIMIRIMTVSGRVVREIMQEELGPLKIGNNITDYAWDGKDEFGDQLANGVYLYKVFLRKNGQNVELRPSGGDRGFKNGYGKLYLLR